jgi:hypothetical protein
MPVPSLTAVLRYAVHYLTIQVAVMLTTCALDLSAKGKQKKNFKLETWSSFPDKSCIAASR